MDRKRNHEEMETNHEVIETEEGFLDNFNDKKYQKKIRKKMQKFKKYCSRMRKNSRYGLKLERGEGGAPIVYISSDLKMDPDLGEYLIKICPGEQGLYLQQRSAVGMGLRPEESFELRFSDGEFIAYVYRNVLTDEESLGSLEFEAVHRRESNGWNRGCQADQEPRENHMRHQVNSSRPMKATRINLDNTIVSIEPGGKGDTTCPKIEYRTPAGKKAKVPFCSFLDRAKFVPGKVKDSRAISLDKVLEGGSQRLRDLHSKLVEIYLSACIELGFSEKVVN